MIHIATAEYLQQVSPADRLDILFLSESTDLPRQWDVTSDDTAFRSKMEGSITEYDAVHPFALDGFLAQADEQGYDVVFSEDPEPILSWVESLNEDPGVELLGDETTWMEGSVGGLLPFQVQGINFAKQLDAAVLQWSTGTGKTVAACALIKWHWLQGDTDVFVFVVKPSALIPTQRSLEGLVGLDSVVLEPRSVKVEKGKYKSDQRAGAWGDVADMLIEHGKTVIVCNYETIQSDREAFQMLVEGRRVFYVWDEMPNKLKNRATALYKAVTSVLYTTKDEKRGKGRAKAPQPRRGAERAAKQRHLMLSATPVENSPMDWFNCIRLIAPEIYGPYSEFKDEFVAWVDDYGNPHFLPHKLPYMGALAAHITHQVDKEDPDIARQFPEVREPDIRMLDLHPDDRFLYDTLSGEYTKMKDDELSMLSYDELMGAINVLQMICVNSRMVYESAKQYVEWEAAVAAYKMMWDDHYSLMEPADRPMPVEEYAKKQRKGSQVAKKLFDLVGRDKSLFDDMDGDEIRSVKLRELKSEIDQGHKVVVFTTFNDTLIPILSEHLDRWGVNYVTLRGGMTSKARQKSMDAFQSDSEVQVFLSTDAGSDSINLHAANVVVHLDWPWTWAKRTQRENRVHRITSEWDYVQYITFLIANSVEQRRKDIVNMKHGFHISMFKGLIAEQSRELRKSDLVMLVTGREIDD